MIDGGEAQVEQPDRIRMSEDDRPGHSLRVLLADEDQEHLDGTAELFRGLGHEVTSYAVSVGQAADRIAHEDPDLAVVVLHHDDEHALELIDELSQFAGGPVIVLFIGERSEFLEEAAEKGVAAFARAGDRGDVQAAIEVAMRVHRERARLTEQVDQLEGAMERRSVIERAKGILMERHSIDERRAFALLRDHARGRNRKVADVAGAIIEGHGLLPRDSGEDGGRPSGVPGD